MIINAFQEKICPIYGNGLNIRDWLYVRDHCEAIQTVIEKGKGLVRHIILEGIMKLQIFKL